MTVNTFYAGPDSQVSSGPYLIRSVLRADIWPEGLNSESDGAGDKDVLVDGMHQAFAVGAKANRPNNMVGVSIGINAAGIVNLNFAYGYLFKAYVANVTAYAGGGPGAAASAWDASLALGDPVYVDDSVVLDAGITLSRAVSNDAPNANPLCGFIWYDQDELPDYALGGLHYTAGLPKAADPAATENVLCTVFLCSKRV
jgi:hypothetical protein